MSQRDNLAAQKAMGEAVNSGHLEEMKRTFANDVKDHDPAAGQPPGPEGFVEFFRMFRAAFPDLAVAIDHTVCDEENVAIAYTISGTHEGTFSGIPPTGKKVHVRGVQIARFEDGKIVERWGSSDELGILKQLGARVSAAAGLHKAS